MRMRDSDCDRDIRGWLLFSFFVFFVSFVVNRPGEGEWLMDCIHARLVMVLHDREPVELDAVAQAALEQHLERCADCLAWSHQESRVDETLGRAIQAVPVPADLPSKILHQLEQQRRPRRLPWL